jgi:hypothetical protein
MGRRGEAAGVRDGHLRGALPMSRTTRQVDVLAAFVAAGGSICLGARGWVTVSADTASRLTLAGSSKLVNEISREASAGR